MPILYIHCKSGLRLVTRTVAHPILLRSPEVLEEKLVGAIEVLVDGAALGVFVGDPQVVLGEFATYLSENSLGAAHLTGAVRSIDRLLPVLCSRPAH